MYSGLETTSIPVGEFTINHKILANPSNLYVSPTLPWLTKPTKTSMYPQTSPSHQGIFELVQEKFPHSKVVIGLLDLSIPVYLAPKFHRMNIEAMSRKECKEDESYVSYAMWYVQYCKSFGLQYLSDVQNAKASGEQYADKTEVLQKYNKAVNLREKLRLDDLTRFALINGIVLEKIGKVTKLSCTPTPDNCIKKSVDFMLQAGVLIQLPWNTVAFHQWLLLAILDVLTFEKYTLELRRWAIPTELVAIASELLLQVRTLKERILLGFVILCQQIEKYPNVDTRHPAWVFDVVVIPSLPTLQLIQPSGKGYKILESIKVKSWLKSEPASSARVYVKSSIYNVNKDLEICFENTCYGLKYWLETIPIGVYCPVFKPTSLDVKTIISKIGKQESSDDSDVKDMTYQEVLIMNQTEQVTGEVKIKLTLDTINAEVLKKARVSEEKFEEIKSAFEVADEISLETLKKTAMASFTMEHSLIHSKVKELLCEHEREPGILRRIVLLQLQILEREQVLRITENICRILAITPVDINAKKYRVKQLSLDQISDAIREIKSYRKDRQSVWLQFPEEWNSEVKSREPKLDSVECWYRQYSHRIGRIVINSAKKSFEVFSKGGDVYPHWLTVQYVLPSLISLCFDKLDSPEYSREYTVDLIHGLLEYYEKSSVNWYRGISLRTHVDTKSESMLALVRDVTDTSNKLKQYFMYLHTLVTSHINPRYASRSISTLYINPLLISLIEWYQTENITDKAYPGYEYLKLWLLNGISIVKILCDTCKKAWNYPDLARLEEIGFMELYDKNEMITDLYSLVQATSSYALTLDPRVPLELDIVAIRKLLISIIDLYSNELCSWRFQFVTVTTSYFKKKNHELFREAHKNGQEILTRMYVLLRKFRSKFPVLDIGTRSYWPKSTPRQLQLQNLYARRDLRELDCIFGFEMRLDAIPASDMERVRGEHVTEVRSNLGAALVNSNARNTEAGAEMSQKSGESVERRSDKVRDQSARAEVTTGTFGGMKPSFFNNTAPGAEKTGAPGAEQGGETGAPGAEQGGETGAEKPGAPGAEQGGETGAEKTGAPGAEQGGETGAPGAEQGRETGAEKTGAQVNPEDNVKKCRNCYKLEKEEQFTVCEKCISDNYPDVNYFCNELCKDSWWSIEHMAEHLEFELGLSVFNVK